MLDMGTNGLGNAFSACVRRVLAVSGQQLSRKRCRFLCFGANDTFLMSCHGGEENENDRRGVGGIGLVRGAKLETVFLGVSVMLISMYSWEHIRVHRANTPAVRLFLKQQASLLLLPMIKQAVELAAFG